MELLGQWFCRDSCDFKFIYKRVVLVYTATHTTKKKQHMRMPISSHPYLLICLC